MSVVIPDMPMPRGCGECWLTYFDYDEDECPIDRCVLTGNMVWNDLTDRPDDCILKSTEIEVNLDKAEMDKIAMAKIAETPVNKGK